MKILILMSGSIACAKATGLISLWKKAGHEIKIACTASTFEFVGQATLEGLSGHSVLSSVFAENELMEHIHISRWADCLVLVPATANVINKLSAGIADDIVTTSWIAALSLKKPMYLAPAMNSMMWNYPATQNSLEKLQQWGVQILRPNSGDLACGEKGSGRLMEIEAIDQSIFGKKHKQKLLITAGGTREYIDGVRYIGNLSTGRTGAEMADYFSSQAYEVTWLGANNAIQPKWPCTKVFYETFDDLSTALQSQLQNNHYDSIIHAAAISDFSVAEITINKQKIKANRQNKLPTSDTMQLQLKKNPKLVSQLLDWSKNKKLRVVAFKLTNSKDPKQQKQAIEKLLNQASIDYVAHNDLSAISQNTHPFHLYGDKQSGVYCASVRELCRQFETLFVEK